jgi:hypothetical protein
MLLKHYLIAFLLCVLCYTTQAATDDPTDNAHFGFIENKGQIHDQFGNSRNDIRFMYYDDQFKLTLRTTGFSYEIVKTDYVQPNNTESGTPLESDDDKDVDYSVQYTTNQTLMLKWHQKVNHLSTEIIIINIPAIQALRSFTALARSPTKIFTTELILYSVQKSKRTEEFSRSMNSLFIRMETWQILRLITREIFNSVLLMKEI